MTTPAAGALRGTLLRLGDDVRADHILPPAYAFLSDPAEMGKYALSGLGRELEKLAQWHPVISAVRGRGLMLAFDLPDTTKRDAFWKGAYELGLLVVRCGERSIRLRPVLDVTEETLEAALRIMDKECRRLS